MHVRSYKDLDVLFYENNLLGESLNSEPLYTIYEIAMVPSDLTLHVGLRESSRKDRKVSAMTNEVL